MLCAGITTGRRSETDASRDSSTADLAMAVETVETVGTDDSGRKSAAGAAVGSALQVIVFSVPGVPGGSAARMGAGNSDWVPAPTWKVIVGPAALKARKFTPELVPSHQWACGK